MDSIERKIIADGVAFNNIKVNRFKTIRMSINLYVPLNVKDAAHNALLRGLLTRSCKAYPDFTQFSKRLSALYGTDIVSSVKKTGDYQVLTFTAVGIDDRYVFTEEEESRIWWKTFIKTFLAYTGTGLIPNNLLLILWVRVCGIHE